MGCVVRHKGSLKRSLAFWGLVMLSPLGCKLEDPTSFGEQCPPGDQVIEGTNEPYIDFDNIKCFEKHFDTSEVPFKKNFPNDGNCCDESHDVYGGIWHCVFSEECLEIYEKGLNPNLKSNYLDCQNYFASKWFEKKKEIRYSVSCDYDGICEDNVQQFGFCPEEYANCRYDNEKGFFCSSACTSPLLTCTDELSENQSGRICVNPANSIWHCGAKGSCSEDSGNNFKGAICNHGLMICENNECVCPNHYSKCGDVCVDIYNNPENCGGCSENDSRYRCESGKVCIKGKCVENTCHDNTCGSANCSNSAKQCGPNCIDCLALPYAEKSSCLSDKGQCIVSECAKGFHILQDGTSCEMNSGERCAPRNSQDIKNCFDEIPNSEDTYCDWNGNCWLKKCKEGFAKDGNMCLSEADLCKSENHEKYINFECRCEVGYSPCYVEKDGVLSVSKCVDLFTDNENCGECDHPCLDGLTCQQAQCL